MSQTMLILLPGVWLGFVLGISFLEAPLKFRAPGITRALGLGIGKLIFGALNKVELVLATFLALVSWSVMLPGGGWIVLGILLLLLVVQTFILLPNLTKRVTLIQSGVTPPPSKQHLVYIMLEIVKVVMLLLFVFQL